MTNLYKIFRKSVDPQPFKVKGLSISKNCLRYECAFKTKKPRDTTFLCEAKKYIKRVIWEDPWQVQSIVILQKFLKMLITTFKQWLKKSIFTSKIQRTFLERLNKFTLFHTTHTFTLFHLLSLDVKSSCTNVLNAEGIKSYKTSLENYSKQNISTKVITTSLELILTLSNLCSIAKTTCR